MNAPRFLSDQERVDWLRLARTPGIGPVTFAQLLSRYPDASAALQAVPDLARKAGRSGAWRLCDAAIAEAEIEASRKNGARIVASCEPDFPNLLRTLSPPPPILSVIGDTALAVRPTLALVGARDASAAGRKMARDLAAALGKAGYVIVSGLALGIDGEAHAASLASGTIAVVAGGVDQIYPPQHQRLYQSIAAEGLIVSESPYGYTAKAQDFPRRNRIITGLSIGVVVIEAAARSGSLISARMAAEQGREVMAVPGSPLDPRAAGTNDLIRNGATLVRDAGDVLDAVTALSSGGVRAPSMPLFEWEPAGDALPASQIRAVRQALTPFPLPIDEIARAAGLAPGRCAAILSELELAGEAQTLAGGLACKSV